MSTPYFSADSAWRTEVHLWMQTIPAFLAACDGTKEMMNPVIYHDVTYLVALTFRVMHDDPEYDTGPNHPPDKRAGTSPVNAVVRETIMERQVHFQSND